MKKKAILVASFGTSYKETRQKTIGAIEEAIQKEFDEYQVYRAFTSGIIKRKLEREGVFIDNVEQALQRMQEDGVEELIIQPTHIINGMEFDKLMEQSEPYLSGFQSVKIGRPLLTKHDDYIELSHILKEAFPYEEDEALVLMGHGSAHYSYSAYPAFEYVLKDMGYHNMYVGTVEGYPGLEEVKKQLKQKHIQKVCLAPMMIVAGEHVNQDMVGEEDSWKTELEDEGYQVRYKLTGLGELEEVQRMFVRNVKEAEAI